MNDLENIYSTYFKDTFEKLALIRYETTPTQGSGGCIKFKNSAFRLQLLDDRGLIEVDISSCTERRNFGKLNYTIHC